MSSETAIEVRGVSKRYQIYGHPRDRLKQMVMPRLRRGANRIGAAMGTRWRAEDRPYFSEFWALREVGFTVARGETMGIIGRNGSGKSTLLQIIAGTLTPTSGEVETHGRIAALLELGSGFDPDFTGRENVFLNSRILGLSQSETRERYDRIVAFADIGEFIDQPVKTYSSGMFVRLAFAVQAHVEASVVIIDEALAVGDIFFRQKCYARLDELRRGGAAILLVSHAMTDIEQYCDRALLLDHGEPLFLGDAAEATKRYYLLHQTGKAAPAEAAPAEAGPLESPPGFWPPDEVFTPLGDTPQVGTGQAVCTRFAVLDARGRVRGSFEQGETAVFCYEFLLGRDIEVPLAGIVLRDERGINVHGKGALEHVAAAPDRVPAGALVRCRQSIELGLGIAEYSFELGLAAVDPVTYRELSTLDHHELFSRIHRICHVPRAGGIAVGWRRQHDGPPLSHHGVADLPGTFEYGFAKDETTAHADPATTPG